MCTVVFIPKADKYFFASLRDENPLRPGSSVPDIYSINEVAVLAPIDTMAGGTWIGIAETGNVIILLNGGFEKHKLKDKYSKSRGLIVSELLTANLPAEDWDMMDMEGIEPYTLVVWSNGRLFQLVWDGITKYKAALMHNQPYIWSSATLYNNDAKRERGLKFQHWIRRNLPIRADSLLDFFKTHTDSENGFLMNRGEQIKTLSYSFVELQVGASATFNYYDFANRSNHCKEIIVAGHLSKPTAVCEVDNDYLISGNYQV